MSDRALIAGRIEDFVAGLDVRNRVIVTSRIVGYREAPLGGDYQHFTLLDLERDQIEQFLRNWCHETERFLSKDASEEEIAHNAQREIDSVLQAVDNNPGVKRLAVNPLLLTILALIHRNGSRLPNRRVELYDLATKTLLETWQIERMNAGKFNIREGEASQFLWPLAYGCTSKSLGGWPPSRRSNTNWRSFCRRRAKRSRIIRKSSRRPMISCDVCATTRACW
jgi:predicted NACHT family NTPase